MSVETATDPLDRLVDALATGLARCDDHIARWVHRRERRRQRLGVLGGRLAMLALAIVPLTAHPLLSTYSEATAAWVAGAVTIITAMRWVGLRANADSQTVARDSGVDTEKGPGHLPRPGCTTVRALRRRCRPAAPSALRWFAPAGRAVSDGETPHRADPDPGVTRPLS